MHDPLRNVPVRFKLALTFAAVCLLAFGVGGYLLRKLDYPLAPAVLAIVLGPIAEPALRQSLLISQGDVTVFVTRPISGPITVIAIILLFLPLFKLIWTKVRQRQ